MAGCDQYRSKQLQGKRAPSRNDGRDVQESYAIIACVGPHSDDSEILLAWCNSRKGLLGDVLRTIQFDERWSPILAVRSHHWRNLRTRSTAE